MRVLAALLGVCFAMSLEAETADDELAVRDLLVEGYINGVFIARDAAVVKESFDANFIMHRIKDGSIATVTLDEWLDWLRLDGQKSDNPVEYEFEYVDICEDVASAKIHIYQDSERIYTDYIGLYRHSDAWKIVNKTFHAYE
jgi:hypothetical protein